MTTLVDFNNQIKKDLCQRRSYKKLIKAILVLPLLLSVSSVALSVAYSTLIYAGFFTMLSAICSLLYALF